jgi:predicted dehydrogenase
LPTGVRKEWVIRAAEAGKHIVCEKPCAVSAADLRAMLAACARHSVNFMDGVMFRHGARLMRLGAALGDADNFGALRRVTCGFSFAAPPEFFTNNIRGQAALEPHGCLGDLGWYCAQLALWAAGWRLPHEVTARIPDAHGGLPAGLTAEMVFDGSPPPPPPEVHVDHPFLFAIQHRASGACLFLGRVTDPR